MSKNYIINKDYVFHEVLGEAVLVNTETKECINLNETGAFIVQQIINKKDFDEILREMIKVFETNLESTKADLVNFIKILKEKKIILDA